MKSDKIIYRFDLNTWYMTKDFKNLYRIIYKRGTNHYSVVMYYSGDTMYYGTLYQVQSFMNDNCLTHEKYIQVVNNNGK